MGGVSLTTFPWKLHTHATYLADIASHTVPVVVSEPAHVDAIAQNTVMKLVWPYGRTVKSNMVEFQLKSKDKLCISTEVADIFSFRSQVTPPAVIWFYRNTKECSVQGIHQGSSPQSSFVSKFRFSSFPPRFGFVFFFPFVPSPPALQPTLGLSPKRI